ncbi:MAG: gliding motility lipoprotein GldD [Paludibacteraceae bacterium]|nr:gliding motility lipoprotein GldD [Paludibacteraceae bacterium]
MRKNRILKNMVWGVSALLLLVSCSNSMPKPRGYFRIELPEKEYALYSSNDLPCQFIYAKNVAEVKIKGMEQDSVWLDVVYPRYNAQIYCTYRTLHDNYQALSEDSRRLVYKPHTSKADAITEQLYLNDDRKVYGILYELKGNTASNIQFVMSDSTKHFLRGALYINENPKKDSIAPVVDYIREDIIQLIESLEWK